MTTQSSSDFEHYGIEEMHMTTTTHLTRWGARRARKRWLKSLRGRDAYVRRLGPMDYSVSYIDYAPPRLRHDEIAPGVKMGGEPDAA